MSVTFAIFMGMVFMGMVMTPLLLQAYSELNQLRSQKIRLLKIIAKDWEKNERT